MFRLPGLPMGSGSATFRTMVQPSGTRHPPASVLAERRARAARALGGGVMVLGAAPIRRRSRDTEYPYRPDSDLFYLTGVTQPDAVAVLTGGDEPRFILFVPERDPRSELWSGPRPGPEEAAERFGADETLPLRKLDDALPDLLAGADRLCFRLGRGNALERMVVDALGQARMRGPRTGGGPRAVEDPGQILDDLRLVKDAYEIETIREAVAITVEGHLAGMNAVGPGVGEWVVEATVDATFRRLGARGAAFETIVGSGPNGCVLHYVANDRVVMAGDLVLVDAGAEVGLYAGDVTRTYPADGRFTPAQRAVYDVVDRARAAGIAAARPGGTIADVHRAAVGVITEGLVDLGVLSGTADALVEEEAYKPWFPHQTSHWLGLDVHDPGDYARDGASRVLEPGMVFTVEPGLYFAPGAEGVPADFAGIGVRVEDDVLVTFQGVENLTAGVPTDADAVEARVRAE